MYPHMSVVASAAAIFPLLFAPFFFASANTDTIEELREQIASRASEIEALEREIRTYENEVTKLEKEAGSLKSTISAIDAARKKIELNITVTNNKIEKSNLNIKKLTLEILDKERDIARANDVIALSIQKMNEAENRSFVEVMLSNDTLSDFFDQIDGLGRLREFTRKKVRELEDLKKTLVSLKSEEEREKASLEELTRELREQKAIQDNRRKEKNRILVETQNKQSNFEKILAEKIRKKEQFEQELLSLESRLKIVINPDALPPKRAGVFGNPLDKMFLTQPFGDTEFARTGAYNGRGHNGIDLRASRGTRVYSVESGTVVGTGNTDRIPGCYSYGKWILVKHDNGLTTLYAHLDLIRVSKGETVKRGDLIGYSGNTGYSTGPHLHLTAYASQGVRIVRLGDVKKFTNCADAYIPIAPLGAYLDPRDYLREF